MATKTLHVDIQGMVCSGCEQIITATLQALPGVVRVEVSYPRSVADVEYLSELQNELTICAAIAAAGYQAVEQRRIWLRRSVSILIFLILLFTVGGLVFWGKKQMPGVMQMMHSESLSNVALFGIGILTGFHCIGMCGGFVVGYLDPTAGKVRALWSHLQYGFGKTLSYAAIGAGFAVVGAVLSVTPNMRGVAAVAAGLFLILFGLKMLNLIPGLRYLTLRWPSGINRQVATRLQGRRHPLRVGLLTGLLLGCGPLQAMYIMAAGTGEPLRGATLLALFGLGTLIPLWGFGWFAAMLPAGFARQLVKVSAILVIIMGLMMTDRGLKLTLSGYDLASSVGKPPAAHDRHAPQPPPVTKH